jgi:hypothetical protein
MFDQLAVGGKNRRRYSFGEVDAHVYYFSRLAVPEICAGCSSPEWAGDSGQETNALILL